MLYLVVFGSILGYTAFVWLLARLSATVVSSHSYVNPVIAVLVGAWLGGEHVTKRMLVGAAVVLLSVVLVLRAGDRGRRRLWGMVRRQDEMDVDAFRASMKEDAPEAGMPAPLAALWWDAKGDWKRAHGLVDDLETKEGMAVHAYLHRKEGDVGNAGYWYRRSGATLERGSLEAEWEGLVARLAG